MKTIIVMTMTAAVALTSGLTAADSKVKRSTIEVNSYNEDAYSNAIGKESLASVGSVNLRDSKVRKSTIRVHSDNEYAWATAEGDESTSTVGSFTAE